MRANDNAGHWGCLADRGRLALAVMSLAHARAEGIALHPDARLCAELRPDDARSVVIGFDSLAALVQFIRDMAPHAVHVLVEPHESDAELRAAIRSGRHLELVRPDRAATEETR